MMKTLEKRMDEKAFEVHEYLNELGVIIQHNEIDKLAWDFLVLP